MSGFARLSMWMILVAGLSFGTRAAAAEADPEAAIVGRWDGVGIAMLMDVEFFRDHTYKFDPDDPEPLYPPDPPLEGTWEFRDGKYHLTNGRGPSEAEINSDGLLVLQAPLMPGPSAYKKRGGSPKAAAATAGGPSPEGEWRFAYPVKTTLAAAPPFDVIEFMPGKLRLTFTPFDQSFVVDARVKPGSLSFRHDGSTTLTGLMNYMPLGRRPGKTTHLSWRWGDDGQTLILANKDAVAPFDCEWAFLPPERFLADETAGRWIGQGEMEDQGFWNSGDGLFEMDLSSFGRNELLRDMPRSYYRLWPSPFGNAMTLGRVQRGMGLINVEMLRYEIADGKMTLHSISNRFGSSLELDEKNTYVYAAQPEGGAFSADPVPTIVWTNIEDGTVYIEKGTDPAP